MANKEKIGKLIEKEISQEMKESYIDYAMSVIVSRALPDVRDGLKPVQRRILYAMYEDGLKHNAKFRKSAQVIGSVLSRYHPHGDMAVYDALVRMAQDFTLRYPLIQGQGNFGCFTKDTKVRLTDGRNLTFEELIKEQREGKRHWTFTFNPKTQKIEIAEIKNPRLTRKKEKIMEVTLDNGEKIKCTLDHQFMLRDGSYKKAKDLKVGDSLMPLYTKLYEGEDKNLKGYEMIFQPLKGIWEFVHHLADQWNLRHRIYKKSAGRIRHHKDFNKLNNNPENIIRIQWQDHWKYHKEIASIRHKNDPEYVKKLAEGRRKYIETHHQVFTERAKNLNKKLWQNPEFRKRKSEWIKQRWRDPKYREFMRKALSENLKRLWKRKDFQELLSKLKSKEMKERWQNKNYRAAMAKRMRQLSLKLWLTPAHRRYISELMAEKFKSLDARKRVSEIMKALWQNPEYRAKFPTDFFSKIAKILWRNPEIKKLHRVKAIKQWQDPEFRKKFINGVITANRDRLKRNPNLMKELAQKAAISLHKNWQNPVYKERVIRSKILGYVYSLLEKYQNITPEIYEKERTNNGVPKIENALKYFEDFSEILTAAQRYNHKVAKIRILRKKEDVYDLTIEPWHNFALSAGVFVHNSIDGDEAAAYRYTEARLSKIGEEMLRDIEKDTVDFIPNYDGTRKEPVVLPSPLPQLLLNGCVGIAVGMATNIPPHNLKEVCDALIYLIDHPKADTEDLFKFIQGPDFPTGGLVYNKKEMIEAYSMGRGPILVRAKAEILENERGRPIILISEIPYQVQKSQLLEQMAKLVTEKKIEGIKDIRDESDREGLRIVIELSKGAYPKRVLNALYKFTDLQKVFHLNIVALVEGILPRSLSLVDVLNHFLTHRREVVLRRSKFELERAKERGHILEGIKKCLGKIEEVVKIIKGSKDRETARERLMKRFSLDKVQAEAILETKLAALARLEREKVESELKEISVKIKELSEILKSEKKVNELIKKELLYLKENFGDERMTKILEESVGEISEEELIPEEETLIALTRGGYIKRSDPKEFRAQKRGGKGILGIKTIGEDVVEHFLLCSSHDNLLVFTDSGKVFKIPVYEIPKEERQSRGKGIFNFLEISPEDRILSLISIGKKDEKDGLKYILFATKNGMIKKTPISEFKNVRRTGLIAISLKKGDLLRECQKSSGEDEIILVTKRGQGIRFKEKEVREMGRQAAGIKGIKLRKDDEVVGMEVIKKGISKGNLLFLTENGFGKRTEIKEFRIQKRGGMGIKCAKISQKSGDLVEIKFLSEETDLICISRKGKVFKTKISLVPKQRRESQGVKIMKLEEGDKIASAICI